MVHPAHAVTTSPSASRAPGTPSADRSSNPVARIVSPRRRPLPTQPQARTHLDVFDTTADTDQPRVRPRIGRAALLDERLHPAQTGRGLHFAPLSDRSAKHTAAQHSRRRTPASVGAPGRSPGSSAAPRYERGSRVKSGDDSPGWRR